MPLFAPILAVVAAFVLASGACAETISVYGRSLNLVPPPGYCKLGSSAAERSLHEFQRTNTAAAGDLVQLAAPCSELASFKAGRTETFTRWVQVLVLKPKGQLKIITTPREQFVRSMATGVARNPPDMQAISRRIREHLAKTGSQVTGISTHPLGTTKDAYFTEIRMTASVGRWSSPVVGIMAITVASQLPLGVYAFATPEARGETPAETSMAYLRQVVSSNP